MKKVERMRNEKDVKAACKEIFKKLRVYYYMPVPALYSRTGEPDFICCAKGRYVAVETKFGYNKPTPRQEVELESIRLAGGITFVINERNIAMFEDMLVAALELGGKDVESKQ